VKKHRKNRKAKLLVQRCQRGEFLGCKFWIYWDKIFCILIFRINFYIWIFRQKFYNSIFRLTFLHIVF
jgi:hypothetical protein